MYENNYPNNYNGANAESGSEASQSGSNAYYYEQPKPGAQNPKTIRHRQKAGTWNLLRPSVSESSRVLVLRR